MSSCNYESEFYDDIIQNLSNLYGIENEKNIFIFGYKRYLLYLASKTKLLPDTFGFARFIFHELNIPVVDNVVKYNEQIFSFQYSETNSINSIFDTWEFRTSMLSKKTNILSHIEYEFKMFYDRLVKATKKFKKVSYYNYYLLSKGLGELAIIYGANLSTPQLIESIHYPINHNHMERTLDEKSKAYMDANLSNGKSFEKINESNIESYLINNLNLIEEGLKFVSRQYEIRNGRLDILAIDKNGTYVIIELKIKANKDIVWQASYYPEQFKKEKSLENVRFIAMAPHFPVQIKSQLLKIENIELIEFRCRTFRNKLEKIEIYTKNNRH